MRSEGNSIFFEIDCNLQQKTFYHFVGRGFTIVFVRFDYCFRNSKDFRNKKKGGKIRTITWNSVNEKQGMPNLNYSQMMKNVQTFAIARRLAK